MTDDTYRTVEGPGESAFEVRKSEFIGHARHVRSVEAAEAFVEEIDEEYPDASHNVPAYRVRVGDGTPGGHMLREYESDDGEPTGSAGKPALNVLVQRDLENVVVVVTRYYGGTNLGVGGLARSYSRATKEAIDDAGVTDREPHEEIRVTVTYDDSGTIRGILESEGHAFEAEYETDVRFVVLVPRPAADALRDRIQSATSGRAEIE